MTEAVQRRTGGSVIAAIARDQSRAGDAHADYIGFRGGHAQRFEARLVPGASVVGYRSLAQVALAFRADARGLVLEDCPAEELSAWRNRSAGPRRRT